MEVLSSAAGKKLAKNDSVNFFASSIQIIDNIYGIVLRTYCLTSPLGIHTILNNQYRRFCQLYVVI